MRKKFLTALCAVALMGVCAIPAVASDFEITGDAEKGKRVFRKCQACHAVGEDAKSKVGPVLNGVLGRTAGTSEGFSYSSAMIEAGDGGLIWTPETIGEFLKKPKDFVSGTKMSFAGLRKDAEVDDVVAYLAGFD